MQLRVARLCLDCNEIHDDQTCPQCASEAFAYLTRWVPEPERRARPRPDTSSPEAEVYRTLTASPEARSRQVRLLSGGTIGVAMVALAGWMWRRSANRQAGNDAPTKGNSDARRLP